MSDVFVDVSSFVKNNFDKRLEYVFSPKPEILSVLKNDSRKTKAVEKLIKEIRRIEAKGMIIKIHTMKTLINDIADRYAYTLLRYLRKQHEGKAEVDEETLDYLDDLKQAEDSIGLKDSTIKSQMGFG